MSADLVIQTLLAWVLLLIACIAVVELAQPLLRRQLRRVALDGRLGTLVALCWLPALLAPVVLAGCYAPWLLAAFGWGHDHCQTHLDHIHLCVQHVHAAGLGVLSWLLLAGVAAWLVAGVYELVSDLRRGLAFEHSLSALADDDASDVTVVEADVPLSATAGLWSPRIFVTTALLGVLSPAQRRAVLEHERCHAREHHALIKLLAAIGTMALRRSTRRVLLRELALACERRSDEAAAAAIGDRLEVASTLLTTRRAQTMRPSLAVLSLHGSELEARVRGLTERPEAVRPSFARLLAYIALVASVGLVLGHELHHGLETLLSVFLV